MTPSFVLLFMEYLCCEDMCASVSVDFLSFFFCSFSCLWFCLFWFVFVLLLFYLILFYYCPLEAFLSFKETQKSCGSRWEGRWKGSGQRWGIHNQNTLYERKSIFSKRQKRVIGNCCSRPQCQAGK